MANEQAGTRFMTAFNDIEHYLRTSLEKAEHVEFGELVHEFDQREPLTKAERTSLFVFNRLRNAICHGRYYGGKPIAEPVHEVVIQIERLRDQIKNRPKTVDVLGERLVCSVAPNEPISAAFDYVRKFDYSQLPVYEDCTYAGLLTTNAIARWLASQLAANDGLAESETIAAVLQFTEPRERAIHVPKNITVADALHRFDHKGQQEAPVTALILTANGKTTERPLSLVVTNDLPDLFDAVKI